MSLKDDPVWQYYKGETLRLAARAMHRQAKKRWPDCPYPPKGFQPQELPIYEAWFDREILARYDEIPACNLTRWELKADERWINAVTNAHHALLKLEAKNKQRLLDAAGIDPYGHLTWGVGDGDDFICLDWGIMDGKYIFQSVVNSETGCFIEEYDYEADVPPDQAVRVAIGMVDWAYEWCFNNEVKIDHEGWNFSAFRFVEDVKKSVGDSKTVNPFLGTLDKPGGKEV